MERLVEERVSAGTKRQSDELSERFGLTVQLLHWIMAVLIMMMLALGALLVGSLGNYATVLQWHKIVGLVVLVLALIRIANRCRSQTPLPLATLSGFERVISTTSEISMYVLFLAQPIVGWALVSSSGEHIQVGGWIIPSITPESTELFGVLRASHSYLAYALLLSVVAHVAAVVFHTVGLRDGLLSRMSPVQRRNN